MSDKLKGRAPGWDEDGALRSDPVFAITQVAVLVKIIVTVLALDLRSFDTFTLPKSVAAHSMSLVIVALLVWLVARHGRSVLFWSPLHVGVGALLLAFAIATPFALDPTVALFGTFKRYLGLTQMLDNVVLYFSIGALFRDRRSLRLLLVTCMGVAVPVLAYAFVQRLGLDPFHFVQNSTQIPISFLGNPDIAGGFVAVVGITALGLSVLLAGPARASYRLALVVLGVACVGILFTTGVRAGVLAIAGGWLAVLILCARTPSIERRRFLIAAGVTGVLALGVIASPVRARLAPTVLRNDLSVISRIDIWRAAAVAIIERPILGIGPDNFVAAYPALRTQASLRTGELQNSTHDSLLYMATSAGTVGLAAYAFLLVLAISAGLRTARKGSPAAFALIPLLAYFLQSLVTVNEVALDLTFWTALGAIASASAATLPTRRRSSTLRSARPIGAAALGIAVLAISFTLAPRIVGGEALLASEAYTAAGLPDIALPYGQTAVRADPRRAEYWSSYASALDKLHAIAPAVSAFTLVARLQPWQPLSWENLAVVWSEFGNPTAAYAAANRIPTVDPYDGTGRSLDAELAYESGDFAKASKEGEYAIAYKGDEFSYYITISAYAHLKDYPRGEALSREAIAKYPTTRLRLEYAAILADESKTTEAVAVLDALLKDEPKNADAKALLDALTKK